MRAPHPACRSHPTCNCSPETGFLTPFQPQEHPAGSEQRSGARNTITILQRGCECSAGAAASASASGCRRRPSVTSWERSLGWEQGDQGGGLSSAGE